MSAALEPAKSNKLSLGPKLIGVGIGGLALTWVIEWLPLGLMGRWIVGILAPIIFLSFVAGIAIMWMKRSKD